MATTRSLPCLLTAASGRRARAWLCRLSVLMWLAFTGGLRAEISKEYQLKAAFLYSFTKFVEWPAARFEDKTSPIVIGVLGQSPFGDELEKIVKGRTVNGRALVVRPIATADEAATVHLLFVPAGEETRFAAAGAWKKNSVVSVGESAEFAALGGTITFTPEADKVRFAINLESAGQSRLKISAQLLKLAADVRKKS
jgi:hypothetical protein